MPRRGGWFKDKDGSLKYKIDNVIMNYDQFAWMLRQRIIREQKEQSKEVQNILNKPIRKK